MGDGPGLESFRTRRALLAVAGGALVVAGRPRMARGQASGRIRRIGWLDLLDPAGDVEAALLNGLRDLGHLEGQTLVVERRKAAFRLERLAAMARGLAALEVEAIVAHGDAAILAARQATRELPIVMVASTDAVAAGHVPSLGRPGGNITGVSDAASDLAAKQMDLLKQLLPRASRIGVLRRPPEIPVDPVVGAIEAAARTLGIAVQLHAVRIRPDVERAFASLDRWRPEAVVALGSGLMWPDTSILVGELAAKHRIPLISDMIELTYFEGLMSYATSRAAQVTRAAYFVDRILRGARPADLPVEQPTQSDFLINLVAARRLGITVPPSLLARADKVIE
jgi:putative ABC transport system substrate-binding protein